jgi:uncharacterized cupin superfamily protein
MPHVEKPIINIAELTLTETSRGTRFGAQAGRIGGIIGMDHLGAQYLVVPPGRSAFPRHNHHNNEEMFVILEGVGEYRRGDDVWSIKAGDIIAAPAGGIETAHRITNTGDAPIRYLAISTRNPIDVLEYPDSGKTIAAAGIPPGQGTRSAAIGFSWRKGDKPVDYWDGEDVGELT